MGRAEEQDDEARAELVHRANPSGVAWWLRNGAVNLACWLCARIPVAVSEREDSITPSHSQVSDAPEVLVEGTTRQGLLGLIVLLH